MTLFHDNIAKHHIIPTLLHATLASQDQPAMTRAAMMIVSAFVDQPNELRESLVEEAMIHAIGLNPFDVHFVEECGASVAAYDKLAAVKDVHERFMASQDETEKQLRHLVKDMEMLCIQTTADHEQSSATLLQILDNIPLTMRHAKQAIDVSPDRHFPNYTASITWALYSMNRIIQTIGASINMDWSIWIQQVHEATEGDMESFIGALLHLLGTCLQVPKQPLDVLHAILDQMWSSLQHTASIVEHTYTTKRSSRVVQEYDRFCTILSGVLRRAPQSACRASDGGRSADDAAPEGRSSEESSARRG